MSERVYNRLSQWVSNLDSETHSSVTETQILPAESISLRHNQRKLPQLHWANSSSVDESTVFENEFEPDTEMLANPVALTTLTNASVYFTGGRHAVTTSSGTVISQHRVNANTLAELPWQPSKQLTGHTLLLGNSAGANCYYHWMMDILPKLGYLEKIGISLSSIDHFLVREVISDFQRNTLALLGIDQSRIVECVKHPYYRCDQLFILNLDHRIGMGMQRFVPEWIKEKLQHSQLSYLQTEHQLKPTSTSLQAPLKNQEKRIKLYITRPAGVRRCITNEEELIAFLKDNGFLIKAMEGLSVQQQSALLAQTDVLVAAHGGALTNMIFACPGVKIVELFGSHVYPYYYSLANLCGHEYHALLQTPEHIPNLTQLKTAISNGSAENQRISQHADFSVNITALANCLLSQNDLAA